MPNSVASLLPEGQADMLSAVTVNGEIMDPAVLCRPDHRDVCALPAADGQGHHGGHPPTAVGAPDPHDDSHDVNLFADEAFAGERARYLLDYGQDVVARLQPAHVHVATALAAQLTHLAARLHTAQTQGEYALLPVLVNHLDDALAPGELLLREVEG